MNRDRPHVATELLAWEDLATAPPRHFGPVTITEEQVERFLELTGERHPLHTDTAWTMAVAGAPRVVPAGLVHSVTSGWAVRHAGPAAVLGLRSVTWDFVRPLHPGMPFWFVVTTTASEALDERIGLVDVTRRVLDDQDRTHALGHLNLAVLRREALTAPADGPS